MRRAAAERRCPALLGELLRALARAGQGRPRPDAVDGEQLEEELPLGRLGETEHISKAVLFLASDDAAHVQGQELFVDGGATASPSGAPIYRG